MKAVSLVGPGELRYGDVPDPEVRPGAVLLQVKASSICGSDLLRVYHGNAKRYPVVLGHETAGIVVEVGEGVDAAWLGKRAALIPLIPDASLGSRPPYGFWADGSYSFIGSRQDGGFAEFVALPAANLLPVPDDLPFEHAAIVEPFSVACHVMERGGIEPGMQVAILGAGSLGLCCVQWARLKGAGHIYATDIAERSLAAAAAMGAHTTVNAQSDDVISLIMDASRGGVDLVVEATGLPAVLEQAPHIVRPRGVIVCLGNLPPGSKVQGALIEQMMKREAELRGNWMSYSSPFPGHEWSDSLVAMRRGAIDAAAMISHRFALAAAPEVFRRIHERELQQLKVILQP